ncbi:hypothetical protein ACWOAH_01570 [Vagococcus vulneris]|uniref:Uncharacterized protein n=1 Tax=Vagococcus vulneris TaxID=1977869 RepID=A0A430A1G3_9ENTE|nr:hypothetical protein [Vagococcus vulneris]RSU00238.1 hypothetical protein CBF37_02775 [Vagococcus vulneris]
METIIDGKTYSTDTAKYICGTTYEGTRGYSTFYRKQLYRTRKGQFFLDYEGGNMTEFAIDEFGNDEGSSGIMLYDDDEAKEFIEKYGTVDMYNDLFGYIEG